MFFKIKNKLTIPRDALRSEIIMTARERILFYSLFANECEINNYLVKKYNSNLKQECLNLLSNIKIVFDSDSNATVLFRNRDADKLATLITYGCDGIHGSKILRDAFYWGD